MSEVENSGECWAIYDNLLRVEGVSIQINSIDSVKFYTPWWVSLIGSIVGLFVLFLMITGLFGEEHNLIWYGIGILVFFGASIEILGIEIQYLSIMINGRKHIVKSMSKNKWNDLYEMKRAIEQKLSS